VERMLERRLSVAPMMEWTDRHCRRLLRLCAPDALLYTEMVSADALLHGEAERHLRFTRKEQPIALQVGGADPRALAEATRLGAEAGYREVNLNVGCPSDRVQRGRFGACLMAEPTRVAECVDAMRHAADVPVTVKCRLGIDGHDTYEFLRSFVETLIPAGCSAFIVHARIARLDGLSPKENREIPPLDPARVYRLKRELPEQIVILNGGIREIAQARDALARCDGVMIGRGAYQDPWFLRELSRVLFPSSPLMPDRHAILEAYLPYVASELERGTRLWAMARHLLGLFNGLPGARRFRRHLSNAARAHDADASALIEAARFVSHEPRATACSSA
jgi:tRNA-dihydrouridine synthase A